MSVPQRAVIREPVRAIAVVVAGAVLLKLCFIALLPHGVYLDVITAIDFGRGYRGGGGEPFITSKTFVGPLLWAWLYGFVGVWGLKLVNLAAFLLLVLMQLRFGETRYSRDTTVVALFLFAFYPGTNLNVVAGEQDDCVSAVFFSLGLLLAVQRRAAFAAGLLMGVAFVFKFSAGIFYAGVALWVLVTGGWRAALWSATGMALPFVLLNVGDQGASLRNLVHSIGLHLGYSTWSGVGFKLLSTGLLVAAVLPWWVWWRERTDANLLCCLIPSAYLAYVLLSRDAFSASYLMMQGMFVASFPLAEIVLRGAFSGGRISRRMAVGSVLAAYLVIVTAITGRNVLHDLLDVRSPHEPAALGRPR